MTYGNRFIGKRIIEATSCSETFVQVLAEQARRLGIRIESSKLSRPPQDKKNQQQNRGRPRDLNGALEISNVHQRVRKFMANKGTESPQDSQTNKIPEQLPFGWEERLDPSSGRRFYIDHVRKVCIPKNHFKAFMASLIDILSPLTHTLVCLSEFQIETVLIIVPLSTVSC